MTTISPSSHQAKIEEPERGKLTDWLFPYHRKIAVGSIFAVTLVHILYFLSRSIQNGEVEYQAIALGSLGIAIVITLVLWGFYRLLGLAGGSETARSLALLTVPALVIAIISAYIIGLLTIIPGYESIYSNPMDLLFVHYMTLAGWGALYLALVQNYTTNKALEKSRNLERITRESEQRALRFQLNPHFVFNALNSVSSLVVDNENAKAEQLVDNLADYMRSVLNDEGESIVSVATEIEQQLRYLHIEQVRFPERLKIDTSIDEDVRDWKIPALIIQPLVENAIKHGVAISTKPVRIQISASLDMDRLKISVANDGLMETVKSDSAGTGTGLANVKERLAAVYGSSAALVTANRSDDMAVASIIVPDESYIFRNS